MEVIKLESTNCILKGDEELNILDLPCTRVIFDNGIGGFETCWKLSPEEITRINETGVIYLTVLGNEHPPVCLTTEPI
jgi:hypothetical protein